MILDSYEKAAIDVLKLLEKNSNIFVIKSFPLKLTLAIIYDHSYFQAEFSCLEVVDILKIVPSLFLRIKQTLPFPTLYPFEIPKRSQLTQDFVMELISQYGVSWIPVESFLYKEALEVSMIESIKLKEWQRYVRAMHTSDHEELTLLLTDSDEKVREKAIDRLKSEFTS